ncbi:MAG: FtsW/RodA/SpoVE family cell cycle protein [Clostridiaceae bacterium]|nr:FtsW/RodA/SpoVE family cell cycle protein [Clostridiaceae bacterium]
MSSVFDERRLLAVTYLLVGICFGNLYLLKQPHDVSALIVGGIICILIGYSHFIIRKFFPDGDKYILIFACILSVFGLVMLYRLQPSLAIKQIIFITVGIAAFIIIVVLLPDLKTFENYTYVYMVILLILMASGSMLGDEVNGSKNWIFIAGYGFQPSEFGKLFLVAYLSSAFRKYENHKNLIEPALVVLFCLGFLVLQKDLGSALMFFSISITMLYIATSKSKYIWACAILFVIGCIVSYKLFGHVRLRFMIWHDLWKYANNESYQVVQSLFAIASGGLFGSGLGLGYPKFVPVRTTDFIFSAICEEMGILVGLGIIILQFLLFYRCMRAAVFMENKFSRLVAVGYGTMFASQVLVIVGGVINMIPLTGITLPLVSYGGSSVLISFCALGIVQKISEEGNSYE